MRSARMPGRFQRRFFTRVPASSFKIPEFESKVFEVETLVLAEKTEKVPQAAK